MAKPKVGVVVPSGDHVHSKFMVSLVSMFQYSLDKFDLVIINPRSSLIGTGRQMGVDIAVRRGCEYILFLDSDMVFPYNILERLYERGKAVVGASYVKRLLPTSWNHQELAGTPDLGSGLREVSRLPLGATLIDLSVFEYWEKPYFRCEYPQEGPEAGMERGEDYYFCDQVKKGGDKVYLDADLSKSIGHIGTYVHTYHDLLPVVS
jgi:hypothetical protein